MELVIENYKKSQFGRIPNDWNEFSIGKIVKNIIDYRGVTPKKLGMDWGGGDIVALSAGNVKKGYIDFNSECYYGSDSLYKRWMRNGDVAKNDIVFTLEAPLGNIALIPDNKKYILSQRTILLQLNEEFWSPYIYQLLLSNIFQNYISASATGSTAQGIKRTTFEKLNTVIPPTITEQKAIATALSDVDDLIANLDKLISKKKSIKQGAMQQLLTPPHKGGKRLAGYTGEWVEKKLGDCLKYEQPTKYIVTSTEYEGQSQTPVLTAGKSFLLGYTDEDFGVFNHYPVIIFDDFTTSNHLVNFSFKVKSSAMKMLQPVSDEIDIKFMFSIMNQIRFFLGDDHKRRWIAEYSKIEVFIPEVKEQKAIAQILSDMDLEIEQLETKKAKYGYIKQGMMQELLTGKTRLV